MTDEWEEGKKGSPNVLTRVVCVCACVHYVSMHVTVLSQSRGFCVYYHRKQREISMRFIVVTGGVVSGLGKGITISSLGRILKSSGLRTTSIKIDPYLNFDSGTMSPFEHGETFVLDDGGETDLDLGNYERFLDVTLSKDHNITTGKVYQEVISRERRGDYLGKTVQIVPHATDLIQEWIDNVSKVPVDGSGKFLNVN